MRVVAALGGNALLQRGQPMTAENQRENVKRACAALAPIALEHELVVSHGNGPQVGLLALQGAAYDKVETYPLDVLDAETEGMIGYMVMQELGNLLPFEKPVSTLLTMIEVDAGDPAFKNPTKPIGPVYGEQEARALAAEKGWAFKPDGDHMRRVVPSPKPKQIFGIQPLEWLLEHGSVVICAGGGGIPTIYTEDPAPAGRQLTGVEAVIDKDLASAVLAADLHADALLIITDVDAVYTGWGTPQQSAISRATSDDLMRAEFAEGSMGPKVKAACEFVERTGEFAAIGSIDNARALLDGTAGTTVSRTPADLAGAGVTGAAGKPADVSP
jgi:carbamate kinase